MPRRDDPPPPQAPDRARDDASPDGDEWQEWYALTPLERLEESSKLWRTYLELGGSL